MVAPLRCQWAPIQAAVGVPRWRSVDGRRKAVGAPSELTCTPADRSIYGEARFYEKTAQCGCVAAGKKKHIANLRTLVVTCEANDGRQM